MNENFPKHLNNVIIFEKVIKETPDLIEKVEQLLHTCFYMRKSLVCDIMEPFRPIVDWQIRKSINLGQFKEEDFVVYKKQYNLNYKKAAQYTRVFFESILNYREEIFLYVRDYYRCFMKGKEIVNYPRFELEDT